tara:strand:- start:633 stop:836 length:204 start_codon:yes stop_codon:yes gene_type:complete
VAELVDAPDLKSGDRLGRAGSIPAPGTNRIAIEVFGLDIIVGSKVRYQINHKDRIIKILKSNNSMRE